MTSKREQALRGLFSCLRTGLPDISVLRNEVLTTAIPETGLVVLRDGDPGEPDILLSPPRYIYKHRADIEAFIQNADAARRDAAMDTLLQSIGAAIAAAETLGETVDMAAPGGPELIDEPVEGAAAIKAARVPVYLEYATSTPLG